MNDVQLTGWFYLSFAGDRDGVDTFFGGAIVRGDEMISATVESHRLKCNPGGEVMGMPIPEGFLPGPEYRERLLTKAEIKSFWPDAARVADIEAERAALSGSAGDT